MKHRFPPVATPAVAAILSTLVAACSGDPAGSAATKDPSVTAGADLEAQLGDTVRLGVGDAVRVEGTDLRVTFVRLIRDYRCALDVVCFWSGDAEVLVRLEAEAEDLHVFHVYGGRFARVGDLEVELVELLPYPIHDPLEDPPPPTIDVTVTRVE